MDTKTISNRLKIAGNSFDLKEELEYDISYIVNSGCEQLSTDKDYELNRIEKIEVVDYEPVEYGPGGTLDHANPMKLRVIIILDTTAAVGAEDIATIQY